MTLSIWNCSLRLTQKITRKKRFVHKTKVIRMGLGLSAKGREFAFTRQESCCSRPFQVERQVRDGLLPDSVHQTNGRYGRVARIDHQAAFRVERSPKCPRRRSGDRLVMAESTY